MPEELVGERAVPPGVGSSTSSQSAKDDADSAPLHVRTEFHFTVSAPFEEAAPLFGAEEERKWARGWNPLFVYPHPAKDQQGAVFRVDRGDGSSVWTTTAFDLPAGHVQYVYVIDNVMVTLIDIQLRRNGERTEVHVVYERTALIPAANERVKLSAVQDAGFGEEWAEQINGYLEKSRGQSR
jgi:hypothetical protein